MVSDTAPGLAVVGYASLDTTVTSPLFRGVDATTIVRGPMASSDPDIGGIAHLATAAATTGVAVEAVSWTAGDLPGAWWRQHLDDAGIATSGVVIAGSHSPAATMLHLDDGTTLCFFAPGDCYPDGLTERQRAAVRSRGAVLLTVCPQSATEALLDLLPGDVLLAWAVKHDDDAYTPELRERLLARADIISFSSGERGYLTAGMASPEQRARAGALVVETRGSQGARWCIAGGGRRGEVPAEPVRVADTTGAGDTFVGTLVGSLLGHGDVIPGQLDEADLDALVARATYAAGALLRSRTTAGTAEQGEQ